jgi:hypothetical protein
VVFLPADLAQATLVARQEAAQNGYNDGIITNAPVNATIVVSQEPNPNRLRVKITRTVPSFFLRLIGVANPSLARQAVAEYVAPVPMGSPVNKLGNDPDNGYNSPQIWLNIAGPNAAKQNGDRYTSKNCTASPVEAHCDTSQTPNNLEYSQDGYFFTAHVNSVVSGQPLRFDFFDPQMVYTGDYCDKGTLPSSAQDTTLAGIRQSGVNVYSDAATRFAAGTAPDTTTGLGAVSPLFCSGDQDLGGRNLTTTFIFRKPDNTPWSNTDNPVINISTCKPVSIPAFVPGSGGASSPSIYNMLNSTDGVQDAQGIVEPYNNQPQLTFADMFHRFANLCTIPSGDSNLTTGDYIIQVRTNASTSNPTVYDASNTGGGHNRYSIRVGFGNGVNVVDGTNTQIYAGGRLPVFANATGANSVFYLARILPYDAGRTLRINLFDMGDASHAGTLQILAPAEYNSGSIGSCAFTRDDNGSMSTDTSTCTLSNVSSGNGFNGRIITVDVPIPNDYTCTTTSATGCWFRIAMTYPPGYGVADTTTWTATVVGNPVRLVQ